MKYLGSKQKIAKYIVPIIQDFIDYYSCETYIEPFVGGANVIDKVSCKNRFGGDSNKYLIALFNYLQQGGKLPEKISREDYNLLREASKGLSEQPDWLIGCAGFLASFNGRFFDGGYAGIGNENGKVRDYYREAKNNILKQFDTGRLDDVVFDNEDYHHYSDAEYTVIYCDPPYMGKKQYSNSKNFDYDEFWNWVRNMSKKNWVMVSEMDAPSDFTPIWEYDVVRSIKPSDKFRVTEKLYRWDYSLVV